MRAWTAKPSLALLILSYRGWWVRHLCCVQSPLIQGMQLILVSSLFPWASVLQVQGSSWAEKQYAEHQIKAEEDAIDNTVNAGVELQVKAKCVATKVCEDNLPASPRMMSSDRQPSA